MFINKQMYEKMLIYLHSVYYYLVIKRNKLLVHAKKIWIGIKSMPKLVKLDTKECLLHDFIYLK